MSRGIYRVQVTRGRDPITGRPRRRNGTVHGTAADADRWIERVWTEMGGVSRGTDLTVDGYLTHTWLPWQRERVRKRTYDGYESKVRLYIVPKLGRVRLADLDAYALDRWLDALRDDKVGDHTRLHAFRVLRTSLRRAVKWRMIAADPIALVDAPKARIPAPDVLTAEEARTYIQAAYGTAQAPVVALALGGGLRRSELCAVTWKDIDRKAGTVTIREGRHQHGKDVWTEPPKSRASSRTIVLPAWAVQLLGRGVGRVTEDPEKVSREYRAWVKANELRYVPLRCLRHTSATLALQSGADIALVSRRLGHSQIGVTARHYIATGLVADATVAAGLDSVIRTTSDIFGQQDTTTAGQTACQGIQGSGSGHKNRRSPA